MVGFRTYDSLISEFRTESEWNANVFMNSFVVLMEWKNFVGTFNEIAMPNAIQKAIFEERTIFVVVVNKLFGIIKPIANGRHHLDSHLIENIWICSRFRRKHQFHTLLIDRRVYKTMTNLHNERRTGHEHWWHLKIVFHNKRYAFAVAKKKTPKCNEWTWIWR